jgi:hypothetical protein
MSEQPQGNDELEAIQTDVKGAITSPEAVQPPAKFVILDGATFQGEQGPAAYFVRTEGTSDTLSMTPGSIEEVLEDLFGHGSEMTDFIVGIGNRDVRKMQAEKLKEKLSDPAIQRRIRTLHAEQQKLKRELGE